MIYFGCWLFKIRLLVYGFWGFVCWECAFEVVLLVDFEFGLVGCYSVCFVALFWVFVLWGACGFLGYWILFDTLCFDTCG